MVTYKPKNKTKINVAKRAMEIIMKKDATLTYLKLRDKFLSSQTCEDLFDDESTLWSEGPLCVATLFIEEVKNK